MERRRKAILRHVAARGDVVSSRGLIDLKVQVTKVTFDPSPSVTQT
jgi:hypothetical protein